MRPRDSACEYEVAFVTELCGGRRGLTSMVGLNGAERDDRICTLGVRVSHEKFKLAGLVAAGCEAGTVIPLHPYPRAAEAFREPV